MGEAIEKKNPAEGTPLKMEVVMNHESMDRIPAIYTNHAEVKIGAEEIQVLFGLRDDFNGEFDGKETVKVQALPQIMMVMTFAQAHSLADTINRQLEIIRSFKDK